MQHITGIMERMVMMDLLDQRVIGYEATKNILRQILDILSHRSTYEARGAAIPHGLLMVSEPGLGKSLMAGAFMEESGRNCTVFHKNSDGESFLDDLREAFRIVGESAPSVLLLEDINLYADSPSPYGPQWAALQSGIDDVKDADVFVIATANTTSCIPQSLLRPGRFDYVINLEPPKGEIAERIAKHYLKDKCWISIINSAVSLTVRHLGYRDLADAQEWEREHNADFQLIEDKQGGIGGTDSTGKSMLEVFFYPGQSAMYAVELRYPVEATEGFGTRLHVMRDAFQITK